MTTPRRTFSYLIRSHFPGQSSRPARLSRLFFPLSTCVYQTHAEGRGCLPFTREAGVVSTPPSFFAVSLTCMDMQLRKSTTFAAQPPPLRAVSSEQVAHIACRRTKAGWVSAFGESVPKADSFFGFFPPSPAFAANAAR